MADLVSFYKENAAILRKARLRVAAAPVGPVTGCWLWLQPTTIQLVDARLQGPDRRSACMTSCSLDLEGHHATKHVHGGVAVLRWHSDR